MRRPLEPPNYTPPRTPQSGKKQYRYKSATYDDRAPTTPLCFAKKNNYTPLSAKSSEVPEAMESATRWANR